MATDFLTKLQPDGPWHVFAIDPDVANAITAKTFDKRKQIEQFVIRNDGKANLYYGLNQTKKRDHKPAKDDITGVDFVHGDSTRVTTKRRKRPRSVTPSSCRCSTEVTGERDRRFRQRVASAVATQSVVRASRTVIVASRKSTSA